MNLNIKKTKRKLTILFTIIIFFMIFVLEFIYFSTKYYSSRRSDITNFGVITKNVENKILSVENFLDINGIPKINKKNRFAFINNFLNRTQINFLIIDLKDNSIVFNKIIEYIDENILINNIEILKHNEILYKRGYLLKKSFFTNSKGDFDIIFFKKTSYNKLNYLFDLFGFILASFLFSSMFYLMGSKFLNKIFEPVEENISDMENFIHNAGHELKTPISVINGNLQLINEFKKYDKKLTLESIEETKKLNKLIDGLIELSNISNNNIVEALNIKDEINLVVESYKTEIKNKNITVNKEYLNDLGLNINKEYFYIFFSNLFSNAIKYNNYGGIINIKISKKSLIIYNTGLGIKKEFLDKIFDRFFQIDNSRHSKGFGIGLSLVKKIANMYKWKIKVLSGQGEYTKIIINFN